MSWLWSSQGSQSLQPQAFHTSAQQVHADDTKIDPFQARARSPVHGTAAPSTSSQSAEPRMYESGLKHDPFLTTAQAHQAGACSASADSTKPADQENTALDPFLNRSTTPPREGPTGHCVRNDPFLYNSQVATRTPSNKRYAGSEQLPVDFDPFLVAAQPPGHAQGPRLQPQARGSCFRRANEAIYDTLLDYADADPCRTTYSFRILVLLPWVIFVYMSILWMVFRHYSFYLAELTTAVVATASLSLILLWHMGRRRSRVPLLPLGMLCFLATLAGIAAGNWGWQQYFRQYFWFKIGSQPHATSAMTPAIIRADAGIIRFFNSPTVTGYGVNVTFAANATHSYANSNVDPERGAGYHDGDTYCVAPVLNSVLAEAALKRVNYWAVGINCCSALGSFYCDDSRKHGGKYGMVLVDHGFPCPGCNKAQFKEAIRMAEAAHGLVSAPGALYVRWVQSPAGFKKELVLRGVMWIGLFMLFGLICCAFLGSIAWFYGFGQRSSPTEHLLLHGHNKWYFAN